MLVDHLHTLPTLHWYSIRELVTYRLNFISKMLKKPVPEVVLDL